MLDETAAVSLAVKHWVQQPPSARTTHAVTVVKAVDQLAACADALSDEELAMIVNDTRTLNVIDSLLELARGPPPTSIAVAALRCLKELLVRKVSPSLLAPWGKTILPLTSAAAPDVHAMAAELVFLCAHHSPNELMHPLTVPAIIDALVHKAPSPMGLFFLLGACFQLASATEPKDQAVSILCNAGLHVALLAGLESAPKEHAHAGMNDSSMSPWQATARGLALHILFVLSSTQTKVIADGLRPSLANPGTSFLERVVPQYIRSEWCEVLEGVFLLISSVFAELPPAGKRTLMAQHDLCAAVHAGLGSSNVRVAASAARCLKSLVLYFAMHRSEDEGSIIFQPAAVLLGPTTTAITPVAAALLDDSFAAGTVGQRVLQCEAAVALAIAATDGTAARVAIATACAQEHIDCIAVMRNAVRAVHGLHLSVLHRWPQFFDSYGKCLLDFAGEVEGLTAVEPTHTAVRKAFAHQRASGSETEKSEKASVNGGRGRSVSVESISAVDFPRVPTPKPAPDAWVVAAFLKACLLHSLHLVPYALRDLQQQQQPQSTNGKGSPQRSQTGPKQHEPAKSSVVANTQSTGIAVLPEEAPYEKAFRLAIEFGKHYKSKPGVKPERRPQEVAKKENEWGSPVKVYQARRWAASDVERRDLFTFEVPFLRNKKDFTGALQRVNSAAADHLVYLNSTLQTCPMTQLTRRCFLSDMYVHVVPRIVSCIEYLITALEEDKLEVVLGVADAAKWYNLDCGNLKQLCAALANSV